MGWGCWGQICCQSDDCFLPILSASKSLAEPGLPQDSGVSPPGPSSACPLQLRFWEMLSSRWPELGTLGWATTPSGWLTWDLQPGFSAYRTLGESGAMPPRRADCPVTSSTSCSPPAPFPMSVLQDGRPWEGTRFPTDHSRSLPGSGPYSLSEAESQQEVRSPRRKVPSYLRITVHFFDQATGVPGAGNLLVRAIIHHGPRNTRLSTSS